MSSPLLYSFSRFIKVTFSFLLIAAIPFLAITQSTLTLKKAVETAVENYGTLKAKSKYAAASKIQVEASKRDYLPNINLAMQQDYGTVNSQFGPLYGFGGLGVGSSGPVTAQSNGTAAFSGLYLTNVNWDFYTFGKSKEKIKTAEATANRDEKDWQQEVFKHKIKTASAYLNLLTSIQLVNSYKRNTDRADTFRQIVIKRALNGLVAGVDSSQANADYSSAHISLTQALDVEAEQNNNIAQLMGLPVQDYQLDSFFMSRIPAFLSDSFNIKNHPVLKWYESRISLSDEQEKYLKTLYYPTFTLVGVLQTRGSGFGNSYGSNPSDYNTGYWQGINPTHPNYLLGVGITWNITEPYRKSQLVKSQQLTSRGLQDEFELAGQELKAGLQLADIKIKHAMDNYREVQVQVKAAADAYLQKSVLYKNGLTTLIDVTQSQYALIKAETDRDIAFNNVWQALLLKAASAGDFSIFENQL